MFTILGMCKARIAHKHEHTYTDTLNQGCGGVRWDVDVPWHLQTKNGMQTLRWGRVNWMFTLHGTCKGRMAHKH